MTRENYFGDFQVQKRELDTRFRFQPLYSFSVSLPCDLSFIEEGQRQEFLFLFPVHSIRFSLCSLHPLDFVQTFLSYSLVISSSSPSDSPHLSVVVNVQRQVMCLEAAFTFKHTSLSLIPSLPQETRGGKRREKEKSMSNRVSKSCPEWNPLSFYFYPKEEQGFLFFFNFIILFVCSLSFGNEVIYSFRKQAMLLFSIMSFDMKTQETVFVSVLTSLSQSWDQFFRLITSSTATICKITD